VHSSNVFVEIDSLREQQVTENTQIPLQLLVNGSHMLLQRTTRRRQIVALLTSKTTVLSKVASVRKHAVAFETSMYELHMNRLEMTL
jgi:methyl coenzyme M reductase beta subunit